MAILIGLGSVQLRLLKTLDKPSRQEETTVVFAREFGNESSR